MDDGPLIQGSAMIETTDSLEAVGVFRGWKNAFFVVVLVCLLVTQVAFWLVDLGVVEATDAPGAVVGEPQPNPIEAAAQSVTAADANEVVPGGGVAGKLDFGLLSRIVGVAGGVLLVAAVLYALTMFFCLMVSLVGRLGGINHIARGFVLSLIMAVLIIPWQRLLGPNIVGVVYSSAELVQWMAAKGESTVNMVIYYLRFSGYWLVVLLLLILSQLRSARWSKAILHRLEII